MDTPPSLPGGPGPRGTRRAGGRAGATRETGRTGDRLSGEAGMDAVLWASLQEGQ